VPVGISFYTFQTMSYTLDVYHQKVRPERDFVAFALYVAYFPQLMAGPIERAGSLLPQLREKRPLAREDLEAGFQRILWGLVKKVVFADRLGVFVDAAYGQPEATDGLGLLLATCCFALQIYLDFSGYTDIAIGVARMMGIRLRENFDRPMLARNPVDFWSRWHISLTTWFRDYLFTALVGRRRRPGAPRRLLNLLVVLVLMGLWHGAGWHFLMMGLFAGAAIAVYEGVYLVTGRPRNRPLFGARPWSVPLAIALTSIHALVLALLFRSPTIGQAFEMARRISVEPWEWQPHYALFGGIAAFVWLTCVVRGVLLPDRRRLVLPAPLRAALWCGLVLLIVHGAVDTTQQYIYFQF
jgi:D-alanyl-lipoteichoic acid acyltransferase DltB (MBOAT superfamily)